MHHRRTKHNDGLFHIHGHTYKEIHGSRVKVMNGTAYETNGGLKKSDLKYNKGGRIVSILKSKTAKKEKRLEKAGYFTQKGKFGFVKKAVKTRKNRTRKH